MADLVKLEKKIAQGFGKGDLYTLLSNIVAPSGAMDGCPNLGLPDSNACTIIHDDFTCYHETYKWVTTEDAGKTGADAVMDEVGGIYQNYCDGDDNDESYCISPAEVFLFAAGKKMWFEARLRCDEAATDDANIIVGVMDNAGANALKDNAGGAPDEYDGAVFLKVDGTLAWQFETSNATSQVTNAAVGTYTDDTMTRVGFYFDGSTTTSYITPYINGVAGVPHAITLSGLAEMHLFFGVKAGGGNEESIEIDYITCVQLK